MILNSRPPPAAPSADPDAAVPLPEPFATKILGATPDATAPDGTAVRLLLSLGAGSLAHFELPPGAVSHAVEHRTVEEIWYVLSGSGRLWRRLASGERIEAIGPRTSLTIPLGTAFQFRADAAAPLAFLAITMPPWPGMDEAQPVEGPWMPTVAAGR